MLNDAENAVLAEMLKAIIEFQWNGEIIKPLGEDRFIDYFNKAIELLQDWKEKNLKE